MSQKELAKKIGVSTSQLIKIISRKTRMVSSGILIGVADIFKLGLSEDVIKELVIGAVDVEILNRLMEHKNFQCLINLMRIYSQDIVASGDMERNQFIDMVTIFLSNLMRESSKYYTEVRKELTDGIK
ncbi:TPA: helix-turn-helix transcriptional regulator [Clostridioides difficile]|uniref:helix-turn-helix domain-containing protein n=1 Tax=Clostridioides difficile TaxID=1496 RepID=UPI000A111EC5|nr:helix-turn-helix transcriptional regulator [Clostridioides difficile]MBY2232194.1 helix-turn-helix transcriptional regulator [Clostridioides difficile]MCR1464000.1 helix-turn-helix transcriptional regulator [Clostridioides difficile]MDK3182083.1 helix-turn-helix transcriptional regulator [Clostridioides difficile]HBF0841285.1 helix-turn-helix transcriptional regulator [Clostridioides difficile]HBF4080006.1 helix-turn-helix transcriptional regulator [Clostridioides difficile]